MTRIHGSLTKVTLDNGVTLFVSSIPIVKDPKRLEIVLNGKTYYLDLDEVKRHEAWREKMDKKIAPFINPFGTWK